MPKTLDDPDMNLTHEQRRDHFVSTLAKSLARFNMTSSGSPAADAAVAEHMRIKEADAKACKGIMHPHADSILWLYAERYGRYLVYVYEGKGSSIHLCFGFCVPVLRLGEKKEVYGLTNRPAVLNTFQLRIVLGSDGFKFYDSRRFGDRFTAMPDAEVEFRSTIQRLMFDSNGKKAAAFVDALKFRLSVMH